MHTTTDEASALQGPPEPQVPGNPEARESALAVLGLFLREQWLKCLGISALVALPCLWHARIEAGDLASHTYNAWLAELIGRGQAPGLWLARQWNNVLFDGALSSLGNLVGLRAAEKIIVTASALIFFWGAVALAAAAARRIPWLVLPCIAMFAYGWTFQMGFMNYYISVGLAFIGVALLWRGQGWERAWVLALAPFIWMAHPLGLIFLVCVGAYVNIAKRITQRRQLALAAAGAALILFVRLYLAGHYTVLWSQDPAYFFNGLDQLLLYGTRYRLPAMLLLVLIPFGLLMDVIRRRSAAVAYSLPLQLYGLAFLAAVLMPTNINPSQDLAPLSFIPERLSSLCAILAICVLAVMKPQKWHLAGFATVAAIFFFYLYSDTGTLNRMENQVERYEAILPPGQRVTATIWPFVGSRVFIHHMVDRACIGRCFSYGNYEPPSGRFRVRARPGNPYVTADYDESTLVQMGDYRVQAKDLPMFQIYQCNLNMTELCMRELAAGQTNGQVGVRPRVR